MSEQSLDSTERRQRRIADGAGHPTCDHRECQSDPNLAIAKHEFIDPPARRFQAWSCAEHDPGGPVIKRVDPGPGNRSIRTGNERPKEGDHNV